MAERAVTVLNHHNTYAVFVKALSGFDVVPVRIHGQHREAVPLHTQGRIFHGGESQLFARRNFNSLAKSPIRRRFGRLPTRW
jgi:hypothetical protein